MSNEPTEHVEIKKTMAAACRILAQVGLEVGIQAHVTHRVPGAANEMWMSPFGLRFHEVTADDIYRLSFSGEILEGRHKHVNTAGLLQHRGVYEARPNVMGVVHTHGPNGVTFSATNEPFRMLSQDACAFFDDVVFYDEFTGVTDDDADARMVAASVGNFRAAILRNHGLLTCSARLEQAVVDHVDLEHVCGQQLRVLACGVPIKEVRPDVARVAKRPYVQDWFYLSQWAALVRMIERQEPHYAGSYRSGDLGRPWTPSRSGA